MFIDDSSCDISSSTTVLDEIEGISHNYAGVQATDENEVRRLHKTIKILKAQVADYMKSNMRLTIENLKLKKELLNSKTLIEKLMLKEAAFMDDNKKLLFYTGLPNLGMFNLILKHLENSLNGLKTTELDNFQKLILTFMKLRQNTTFRGLGYRFLINARIASRIFYSVVAMISYSFDSFILWPDRDSIKLNVPLSFQELYGDRVAVIIDCFEIGTERPNALRGSNQMFSNYKQKYTIKYLIGITPQGVISFISSGYAGRTSDNSVTEDCGILEKLQPGDIILADRGFTVSELVAQRNAVLKTPAFKKENQLNPRDAEDTRRLASVRVHVERLIGQIRNKYRILNGPLPLSLIKTHFQDESMVNHVVRASCIMINLCDCVVPMS